MQKVLLTEEASDYSQYMDAKVAECIRTAQAETFESYKNFDLFVFRWFDIHQPAAPTVRIMIYLDHEDLFFLCDGARCHEKVCDLVTKEATNEQALWKFFCQLLKHDLDNLEDMEYEIAEAEMAAMVRFHNDYIRKIIAYRKDLLRLKRYYEQLDAIMEDMLLNENGLLTEDGIRHFTILASRIERYLTGVRNLRDYVTQMREAYQAQIDIEQNNLMRIFTVITAVFLPQTLMVGWYGMNFRNMPELSYEYGYPLFAAASLFVCIAMLIFFKKKGWF